MQFYTKCAVLKALCPVLERDLCRLHCISSKKDAIHSTELFCTLSTKRDSSYSRLLSIHCHFQEVWQQNMHTFNASSSGACCLCLHESRLALNIVARTKSAVLNFPYKTLLIGNLMFSSILDPFVQVFHRNLILRSLHCQ